MEAYVTQREFAYVLKELKILQVFLADTFGPKFVEFKCKEDILEVRRSSRNKDIDIDNENHHSNIAAIAEKRDYQSINRAIDSFDPLEDEDQDNRVPIVTSTKSLQTSVPLTPSLNDASKELTAVPIFNPTTLSISSIPPLMTTLQQKTGKNIQTFNQNGRLEPSAGTDGELQNQRLQSQPSPPNIAQQPSLNQAKGTTPVPEFQLRGRSIYHKTPPTFTTSNIRDDVSSNDSVPVPIGIETMEGISMPSPPKRSCPLRLPSFRDRSLKLQPATKTTKNTLPASFSSTSQKATAPENEKEIIQCDLCNLFVYSSQIANHMKNHSILDGKNADKLSPLMKNRQICPLCSDEFEDLQAYEKHCADTHPTDGFPCPLCSRRMSSKHKLKRHMITHRNLKYECRICGKSYNRSDNLSTHYKTHSENEQVKVFYCSSCKMAFSSRLGRDKHVDSAHSEDQNSQESSEYDDSSENDTSVCPISDSDDVVETEKIKIENCANIMGLEFEYEGDEDEL